MELQTAIEILEQFQSWRLNKRDDIMHQPKTLTEALDVVLREVNVDLKNETKPLKQPAVSSSSLNTYHIETKDGSGIFNFFTQAKDHKKALRRLETNSSDWKRIVKADRDMTITIKKIG